MMIIFGLLLMILFWGVLIILAVALVGAIFRNSNKSSILPLDHNFKVRETLDTRYARGEITREQYELMKNDLDDTPQLSQG